MSLDELVKVAEKDGYECWDDPRCAMLCALDGEDPAVCALDILPGGKHFIGEGWYWCDSTKEPELEWAKCLVRKQLKSIVSKRELATAEN